MKKISAIIFIVISALNSLWAQNESTKRFDKSELNKFAGVWETKINGQQFRLHLNIEKVPTRNSSLDLIQGYYTYGDNKISMVNGEIERTVVLGFFYQDESGFNKNKLVFFLEDNLKKKRGQGIMIINPSNPDKAIYNLRNTEGIRIGKFDASFSVPVHAVLTRVGP